MKYLGETIDIHGGGQAVRKILAAQQYGNR
jgi:cysteinyl-tRNA synthetase